MGKIDNLLSPIRRAGAWMSKFVTPQNFKTIFITGTVVISIAAIVLIYFIVTDDWSSLKPQWNIFKSWLCGPLFVVGFIISIIRWLKGDAHYTVYYKDKDGKLYQSADMIDNTSENCLVPLIGHCALEPLFWAALIYYPIMVVFAIVASVFPYLLSAIIVAIVAVYCFLMQNANQSQTRDALVIVIPALLTIIFIAILIPFATSTSNYNNRYVNSETHNGETVSVAVDNSVSSEGVENSPYGITFLGLGHKGIKQVVESDETPGAAYVTTYNFDKDGLLVSKEECSNNSDITYTYKYNEEKQLVSISSSDGLLKEVEPKYENGRLVSVHQVYDGQGYTNSWIYDKNGFIVEATTMYDEADGTTTTYTYKDGKILSSKQQDVGYATVTTYNDEGLPISYKNISDDADAQGESTIKYEFDSNNNWTKQTVTDSDGEIEQILERKYICY